MGMETDGTTDSRMVFCARMAFFLGLAKAEAEADPSSQQPVPPLDTLSVLGSWLSDLYRLVAH